MRLFSSSQGDNLRQKGGIKSFDMWESEHWRLWRWGVINRVKRGTHLGDRLVWQEAKIFEGLQGFWVTQPARKLLLAAKVTMVSKLLFSNIWEKIVQIQAKPYILWALLATLSFSPQQLGFPSFIVATPSIARFLLWTTVARKLNGANHYQTMTRQEAALLIKRHRKQRKLEKYQHLCSATMLRLPAVRKA